MKLILRFLVRYARRYLPHYAAGLAFIFLTNYAVVRIPTLIGDALNVIKDEGQQGLTGALDLSVELMLWASALVFIRTLSRILFFNPGRDVEFRVGNDLFGHLLTLQRPFFLRHKVGELASIATNDTQSVRLLVGFAGLQVCNVAVAVPMHLFQMFRTDPVLTAWCAVPLVIAGFYMRWTIQRFYTLVRHGLEVLALLSDRILETYAGVGCVRAHVAEQAAVERFEKRNQTYLDLLLGIAAIRAFSMPVLAFSGLLATGLVLWIGGERVIEGKLAVGHLATFTALLMSLAATLTSLAWVLAAVSRGGVALRRVHDLLDTPPDLPETTDEEFELDAPPRLEIHDLSFRYPGADEDALRGVDAVVEPGRTLGIFGRTGSGKTTLIEILGRVYTPPRNAVLIDGKDARSLPLSRLRAGMAVVPQDPFLFSTTLRDNIRFKGETTGHVMGEDARPVGRVFPHLIMPGSAEVEHAEPARVPSSERTAVADDRLESVLRSASLVDDIGQLPDGLDTIVGERGVMLSGGQRQRTALARALYRQPSILLLDDVLSAVDQRTEARLVEAIRGLGEHTESGPTPTTVIVSHRTSVLEHADEILVLEAGAVVERGTHAELIKRNGFYADAHRHQAEREGESQ